MSKMVNTAGGAGNKWTKDAELDMVMAMLFEDEAVPKTNWVKVHENMGSWGYAYSKSGLQQHWAIMVKNFKKKRQGTDASSANPASQPAAKPAKAASAKRPRPSKATSKTSRKGGSADADSEFSDIDSESGKKKAKRSKTDSTAGVKTEEEASYEVQATGTRLEEEEESEC